uniref:2,4-dihydroxy-7-methoxy-2H-1,4-benzoxazin-3(4H)-one 2-D-glucosyltransferase n=1 Tax=Leersia perrieri TaxID=77586 RepID=A0A0D9XRR9_9ORYZ
MPPHPQPCGRVVLYPFSYQGHANPMFRLAAPDPAGHPPGYRFVAVPDNTPPELTTSHDVAAVVTALNESCAAPFVDRLKELMAEEEEEGVVRCVIADVIWYKPVVAARELGVPVFGLMTRLDMLPLHINVCKMYLWKFLNSSKLYPEAQKDATVDILPPFRVKDLHHIDTSDLYAFSELLANIVAGARRSSGLIINTFESIEGDNICRIHDELSIPVFTIGPLNKLVPHVDSSFIPQDRDCLQWLDRHAPSSVLYVSFGSLAAMDAHKFLEIAWGLAGTKVPFLWVVRPSLVRGLELNSNEIPSDLKEEINGRGMIVSWAPQEEVLSHPSVCAFVTHNGWNSTVESISEGIPMICKPYFRDQMGNARYVYDVWRVGVEMEVGSILQRSNVEAAVEKLVNGKEGKEVKQRISDLKLEAEKCIKKDGSSNTSFKQANVQSMMAASTAPPCGRVALFPLPYHGHITPMLRLAAILHSRGFSITVLHTDLHAPDPAVHPPDYRFVSVPDDTPPELAASEDVVALVESLNESCAAPFGDRVREMVVREEEEGGVLRCVIADVMWYAPAAAARELGVPVVAMMTSSASSFRTFMEYPALLERGFLPMNETKEEDIVDILAPFRVKDLQRIDTSNLFGFANMLESVVAGARLSSGLILNTFDFIEADNICWIHDELSITVFSVGPLNKLTPFVGNNFLPEDRDCLKWLDKQAPCSVLYVSFGSVATMDSHEFLEMAWGLADTKQPFLWVVRPSLIRGVSLNPDELPGALLEEINGRGKIIPWAPQEEVLCHPSIYAFVTHNGWNSMIESISEGVPMICKPCFGDQKGNARYVCDVWGVGVELEVGSVVQRAMIQAAVDKLVNGKEGKEVKQRMQDLKIEAEKCISKGGSSEASLCKLVDSVISF